ncbi:hypothetical protein I0C86_06160 [Plantactinospora sp. S1510]|uniref:ESX secretion-associated protein EspG n=1 Tax=Plantactinospora alkalitolerans TaxID=2789879 RepID=A0ABS0GQU0_9ACTN|nr:hypothetical protein [Plantactinospora alkalitolerans]MBF9128572.1 hypothetical protein [Plantactinospora alkalitolerans]
MGVDSGGLPARRLVLTAPQWTFLVHRTGLTPPPGFAVLDEPEPDVLRAAGQELAARGVVTVDDDPAECRPVAAVLANLATFVAARVVLRMEVSVEGRSARAVLAVAGPAGAALVALPEGAVELSMFEAVALGRELVRVVPAVRDLTGAARGLGQALGGGSNSGVSGRLPLAALAEYTRSGDLAGTVGRAEAVAALGLTAAQVRLVEQVQARTTGVLRVVVSGRSSAGLGVGQVVWLASEDTWLGLRPEPDGSGRRMVAVRPVAREEIGVWLAPYLGQLVEDGDG